MQENAVASGLGRVLVTGATGFVGQHLCLHLRRQAMNVRALCRPGSSSTAPPWLDVFHYTDLNDRGSIRRAMVGVDTVIHLASRVHVRRDTSSDSRQAYFRTNVDGTRVLVEEAQAGGVRRFLLMSSIAAVGSHEGGRLGPDSAEQPVTPYGESKLAAERLVRASANADFCVVIVRPPGVYGPGMKGNIPRLFDLVHRGVPVPVPAVDNMRSLVFVRNLVEGSLAALGAAAGGAATYFVADSEAMSTAALIHAIGGALGVKPRTIRLDARIMRVIAGIGDRLRLPITSAAVDRLFESLTVDTALLERDTGFRPRFSVYTGLSETAEWYRSASRGSAWWESAPLAAAEREVER